MQRRATVVSRRSAAPDIDSSDSTNLRSSLRDGASSTGSTGTPALGGKYKTFLAFSVVVMLLILIFRVYTPNTPHEELPPIRLMGGESSHAKTPKQPLQNRMVPKPHPDDFDPNLSNIKHDNKKDVEEVSPHKKENKENKENKEARKEWVAIKKDIPTPNKNIEPKHDMEPKIVEISENEVKNDEIDEMESKTDKKEEKSDLNENENKYDWPPSLPELMYLEAPEGIEMDWSSGSDAVGAIEFVPGLDASNHIYLFNYIYLPRSEMMTIFLLTEEYLNPKHGLHSWPSGRSRGPVPENYQRMRKTVYRNYKKVTPQFACVYKVMKEGSIQYAVSKVDYVPNNTTRDRYVNDGTEILRCRVPSSELESSLSDADSSFEFILTQKWAQYLKPDIAQLAEQNELDLVHTKLSFNVGLGSGVKLFTKDKNPLLTPAARANKNKKEKYLTLCMPPMSEPLPFVAENVAHHLFMGVEHIYIGTHFPWNQKEEYTNELITLLKPWYEQGLVTIWPHEQNWLSFTDKAKHHWLQQCLYYVKDRSDYTLSLDADEFVLVNAYDSDPLKSSATSNPQPLQTLLKSVTTSDHNEWCWLTFQSFQMWKLMFPDENFMITRFAGREEKPQMTWSKVVWNNKFLWYTGYHAGGACSAQNHDWRQIVFDWREQRDAKHVHRFDTNTEGRIWHYYNCRHIRIEPHDKNHRNPWSKLVEDMTMKEVYFEHVNKVFAENGLKPTYPNDKYDVMKTDYWIKHYDEGKSQDDWHEETK